MTRYFKEIDDLGVSSFRADPIAIGCNIVEKSIFQFNLAHRSLHSALLRR
jgi:hypothetical protein